METSKQVCFLLLTLEEPTPLLCLEMWFCIICHSQLITESSPVVLLCTPPSFIHGNEWDYFCYCYFLFVTLVMKFFHCLTICDTLQLLASPCITFAKFTPRIHSFQRYFNVCNITSQVYSKHNQTQIESCLLKKGVWLYCSPLKVTDDD